MGCAGHSATHLTSFIKIPQKIPIAFMTYKALSQVRRKVEVLPKLFAPFQLQQQKPADQRVPSPRKGRYENGSTPAEMNDQVVAVFAGGHQTFIRIDRRVRSIDRR